ncbi:unnamed protein product [Cladocopium goreaui]|uniref:Intraflagellar transport protein 25 (Flagellar-associated protein 232) n=1 Tax=Cladocopium goreaui TaxID=2562237 RepID=A0A9P1C3P4_9DINO|nr:unnamed protein product [Cladocopium goreaui]
MPDLVAKKVGGKVLMVSSLDENHPGDNMIDGREDSYWISTGLYPQEILLQLSQRSQVSNVKISATNVRGIRIEGCAEEDPVNFHPLAEDALEEVPQRLQDLRPLLEQTELKMSIVLQDHSAIVADVACRASNPQTMLNARPSDGRTEDRGLQVIPGAPPRVSTVQVPRQSPSAEEVLLRVQAGHEKQRAVKDMAGSEAPP